MISSPSEIDLKQIFDDLFFQKNFKDQLNSEGEFFKNMFRKD